MRHKKITFFLLVFFLSLSLISCGSIQQETEPKPSSAACGKFDENGLYKNDWLGITFILPKNMCAATADEMLTMLDGNTDVIINGGENDDAATASQESGKYFDFALIDSEGICAVKLTYEATLLTSGSYLSAQNYLMNIKSQTESNRNYVYTINDIKKFSIAQRDYYMLEVRVGEHMSVKYYAADVNGVLALFTVTEYEGQDASIKTFLNYIDSTDKFE